MPYASTFVRSEGAAIPISFVCNEQVSLRREQRGERHDAVLETLAEVVRNQLGSAASNENVPLDASRQRRARPHWPDRDADILALIDRGDEERAIQQLFERHGPAVLRYCRDSLRDDALADDVQQQVFIEASRDLRNFQRRASMKVWLLAIARHRVLDAAKKRRSARNYFVEGIGITEAADVAPAPGEALDEARLLEALLASVDELPDGTRMAVLLHYQHGLTFAQIARVCRERPGTLCARVARALPLLRRRIEAHLASDSDCRAPNRVRSNHTLPSVRSHER
jgi:RNA polymerase sigma-70 factor (ECF subfamily)